MSCVLLALSPGGVTVARDYLVDVEEVEFDVRMKKFRDANPGRTFSFFSEKELSNYLDEIRRRRGT